MKMQLNKATKDCKFKAVKFRH